MTKDEKKDVLEAVLFTMGDAVEVSRLAEVIETDETETRNILLEMQSDYDIAQRGIAIIELDDSFQMCTRASMYEYLIKIAKTPRKYTITDSMLETLAIVAYKQPVTRAQIEKIRGVSCEYTINRLMEYNLITELGRMDAPGKPILFGTTEEFLRSFGVKSIEELPELSAVQMEEFRQQAEQEAANVNIDI